MHHNEWTYLEDEGTSWLDLDSDGESEAVVPVDLSAGRRWGLEPDASWGYDDAE